MSEPTIPEYIIDRAVELWKRMLCNPKFDNMGDTGTPEERRVNAMAGMMAARAHHVPADDALARFGAVLKRRLQTDPWGRLGVDYGPTQLLADAAAEAGLGDIGFPWKTHMSLYPDRVDLRYGYGSASQNHYRLPDGRWLITGLAGPDMDKVLDYVQGGHPEFQIEDPAEAPR